MKIIKVDFQNLFQEFSYSIPFEFLDGIVILTGPNGYGKSTILRSLYHFMRREFYFFTDMNFGQIRFEFDNGQSFVLERDHASKSVELYNEGDTSQRFSYSFDKSKTDLLNHILTHSLNFTQMGDGKWMSIKTREIIELNELFEYIDRLPEEIQKLFQIELPEEWVAEYFSQEVLLMGAQRLRRSQMAMQYGISYSNQSILEMSAIKRYANELAEKIIAINEDASRHNQQIDQQFALRLLIQTNVLSRTDFEIRFHKLIEKQNRLSNCGLYAGCSSQPEYSTENAKILTQYLEDSERKLEVYDDILAKIEVFTSIINKKGFHGKHLKVESSKGFIFISSQGKELDLTQLSSGEQQVIVMLYKLIFRVTAKTVVLVDEPEISLHVVWQQEYIQELKQIGSVQHIHWIIATHSPLIINDHWDCAIDLFELTKR